MFRTPKRNQQRPPKKGHKEEQDKDIKGVGVIREVTPESRSTSDIPGIMGKTTAEPDQPGQSSQPYANLKHESSEHAKSQSFLSFTITAQVVWNTISDMQYRIRQYYACVCLCMSPEFTLKKKVRK